MISATATFTGSEPVRHYPYIGRARNSQMVVLFYAKNSGICLLAPSGPPRGLEAGDNRHDWCESEFKPAPSGSTVLLTQG